MGENTRHRSRRIMSKRDDSARLGVVAFIVGPLSFREPRAISYEVAFQRLCVDGSDRRGYLFMSCALPQVRSKWGRVLK